MTGFDSKRKIAQDRLDDDDVQVYAQPNLKGKSMTKDEALTLEALKYAASMGHRLIGNFGPFTIKSTLAQQAQAQEPVAWAIYDKRGGSKSLHWPEQHSPNGDANMFDAVPLYTTPPQRTWVGLTDEDVKHLYPYGRSVWGKETFEAIEKALKKKNT